MKGDFQARFCERLAGETPACLLDDFTDAKSYLIYVSHYNSHTADEMAMAMILEKYNTGIALLKQDSNGIFKKLGTIVTTTNDGSKIYTTVNCQ